MSEVFTGPAYRILTPRLLIRYWEPSDAPLLKAAVDANREHLKPWMPWASGEAEELNTYVRRLRRWRGNFDHDQDYVYGIFSPDGKQVLGGTGLHTRAGADVLEIGYWIDREHIGQGLATETSAALVRAAFEIHQVQRVEIHCHPENHASASVPRKLGFTHEATLRQRSSNAQGSYDDSMIWTLFRSEYQVSPAAKAPLSSYDAAGRPLPLEA